MTVAAQNQQVPNNSANINIANTVSAWFKKDFAGEYKDLGDLLVDGFTFDPEFTEFESYRNGIRSVRKKLLTARNATLSLTLNEAGIANLARAVYGSAPVVGGGGNLLHYEGVTLSAEEDSAGFFVDFTTILATNDAISNNRSDYVVGEVFDASDVLESEEHQITNASPDTDNKVYIAQGTGANAIAVDTQVYVKYTITAAEIVYNKSTLFAAEDALIEGAMYLQARNPEGGVIQIWDLASVQLAPNGDISYPLDTWQTIPLLATLQERNATFGTIYTK